MSELERVGQSKTADLYRLPNEGKTPVLLLHGASARRQTFLIPSATLDGEPRALAYWLHAHDYEPWLLDWSGSGNIVDRVVRDSRSQDPQTRRDAWKKARWLDFTNTAKKDLQDFALPQIAHLRNDAARVAAVGHCMGAASLAEMVARFDPSEIRPLTHLVLLTMGLFYESPLASCLKNQDPLLDRLSSREQDELVAIDARRPAEWPAEVDEIYENWPGKLRPHFGQQPQTRISELCDRLSFMYGAPYLEENLAPEIHHDSSTIEFRSGERLPCRGDAIEAPAVGARGIVRDLHLSSDDCRGRQSSGRISLVRRIGSFEDAADCSARLTCNGRSFATVSRARDCRAQLWDQFGGIPLRMYAQGAQNARRGWAASFRAPPTCANLIGKVSLGRFRKLERVTLITGAQNQLWHRDSIDRMYEWLLRGASPDERRRVTKRVLRGYGHQDLLWGDTAHVDVFPLIEKGLR